jgi:hypothetical protein
MIFHKVSRVKIHVQVYKGRSASMSGSSFSVMRKGDLDEIGPILDQFIPEGL